MIRHFLFFLGASTTLMGCTLLPELVRLPAQFEECPQGREIRKTRFYSTRMTDCQVLEEDTKNQASNRERLEEQRQKEQATAKEQQRQMDEDGKLGYSAMSFQDFELDKAQLARSGKKVVLVGVYKKTGDLEELYTSPVAAMQASTMSSIPRITLITDAASREIRAEFLSCASHPALATMGCGRRVRGFAAPCSLSKYGSSREHVCMVVEGGV